MTVSLRLFCGLALPPALGVAAQAQTASNPAAAPTLASDQTVKLSEFDVTEKSSHSYLPSETMTGSRVATPIKDLPFSINIVTNEMMQDFGIFEINENLNAFLPGFSNLDQGGGYNLRGFNASFQLRDGFLRLGRYSSSNVDRIEIINGSNASIYGLASPGGLVNMISKAPKKETTASLFVAKGNYDTDRETLEATGTIAPNTYYITDLGLYEQAYNNQYGHDRDHEFYTAVRHDFSSSTDLTVQYEFADRRQHSPPPAAPQVQDARIAGYAISGVTAPAAYTGLDKFTDRIDQLGPYSMLDRSEGFLTGIFETRFNDVWSLRASANRYWARRWDFNQNTAASTESISAAGVATLTRGANPNKTLIIEDGGGLQTDLLADYKILQDKVNAKSLITFDFNDYYRYEPVYNITGAELAAYTPIRTITLGQPIPGYYLGDGYLTPFPYSNGNGTLTRLDHNRASDWGTLLRQQFYMFDDKLKLFMGLRSDYVIERARDVFRPAVPNARAVEHAESPNVGVNYSVTPAISLFVNYSTGFNPNTQSVNATNLAPPSQYVPGETDYGYDYGIKVATPDQKFASTFDAYYTMRYNVLVTQLDPVTGNAVSLPDGNQLVRGFELTDWWFPTPNLTVYAFWGHINSKYRSFGEQYATVGRSPSKITPDDLGLTVSYAFSGALSGLRAGANWSYMRATPLNNGNSGDSYNAKGVLQSSTLQWDVFIPSYYVVNGFVAYRFKTPALQHFTHEVQFNVNNLLNRDYILTTGVAALSRNWAISYRLSY